MAISGIINTNVNALNTLNALGGTSSSLSTYIQQLSTGKQINGPADNPAGYSIAQRFQTQINGLNQAVSNGNQAVSLVQTATGALQNETNLLQQIRTIAVQSANGSNTTQDRQSLQNVVTQLLAQVQTIATQTQFNGQNLLDGTFAGSQFQVGANSNQIINVSVGNSQTSALGNYTTVASGAVYSTSGAYSSNGYLAGGAFTESIGATSGAGGAGNFTSGTITVSGSVGSAAVTVSGNDASAASIASNVNAVSSQTGVTAQAYTSVAFKVATSGSISFSLGNGTSGSVTNSVNISATVTSSNGSYDLSSLVSAINNQAATTGVSANTQIVNGTQELVLTQSQGQNIVIQASSGSGTLGLASGSTGSLNLVANTVNSDGTQSVSSSLGTLSSGGGGLLVQGVVQFQSASSYSIGNATNIGFASSAATLSSGNGGSQVASVNVSTVAGANQAIAILDQAINALNSQGGALGAVQQRVQASVSNAQTAATNLQSAQSVVQDANIASATTQLSKYQILQQAGISTLAQANALQQSYLKLLP